MSNHMNFHLPGGIPAEDEEGLAAEIRDEHIILVQRSNDDEAHQNDDSDDKNAEWLFWERERYEVQAEETDVGQNIPIGWFESQQWCFVLCLFHHMCFVLQLSVADLHLPQSPVVAMQYMSYIYRGRNPQARLKLFIRYSVRYFNQRRIPLIRRLGLILFFLQQLSSFNCVRSLPLTNWKTEISPLQLLNLVKDQKIEWLIPEAVGCELICPKTVIWKSCSTEDDFIFESEAGEALVQTVPDNCTREQEETTTVGQVQRSGFTRFRSDETNRREELVSYPVGEGSGYSGDEDELYQPYPMRYTQRENNRCSKLDPFCTSWKRLPYKYEPRSLTYWVTQFFLPMLKNIGKELKIEGLKDSKTPLFKQSQSIFDNILKVEFSYLMKTSQLVETLLKLQTVDIQYSVKLLAELRAAVLDYNKVILVALGMFLTNLIINFCRIGYFFFDRYCSKERRHVRKLGEAQEQLALYSELLPTRNIGLRTQPDRPLEIE